MIEGIALQRFMKQLKSRSQDLRSLFDSSITIEYIAEPLKSVPSEMEVVDVLQWMDRHDFDVIGVLEGDAIGGYLARADLLGQISGTSKTYQRIFQPSELVASSTPLIRLLPILKQTSRLFVLECNQVSGIVTCGDLQKAPVRMLLFGLVTLLEMNLLRLVRRYYPDNSWHVHLKPERVETARKLWQDSQIRNEATDLLDYLQFCDKRDLILRESELVEKLQLESKRAGKRLLTSAEQLRNRLAHGQNLVGGSSWPELIDLAEAVEALLMCCEAIE